MTEEKVITLVHDLIADFSKLTELTPQLLTERRAFWKWCLWSRAFSSKRYSRSQ
jgi:hypothetical protein